MARTDPPNGLGHKGLILLPILLALWGLGGCATAHVRGQAALRQERYDEAASYFIEALATDPGRLDARAGLGITRYKQGKFDEAEDAPPNRSSPKCPAAQRHGSTWASHICKRGRTARPRSN